MTNAGFVCRVCAAVAYSVVALAFCRGHDIFRFVSLCLPQAASTPYLASARLALLPFASLFVVFFLSFLFFPFLFLDPSTLLVNIHSSAQ